MNHYSEYKASNIKWISQIPSHWKDMRVRHLLKRKSVNIGGCWSVTQLLSLTQNGIIKKDINSGKGKTHSDYSTYQAVDKGDLVFCLFDIDETPRTVGLSNYSGMITSAYSVFESINDNEPRFYDYFFRSIDDAKGLKPFYSGMRKTVRPPEFLNIKVPQPPIIEQVLIADFLDKKTQSIDELVKEKQNFITLLEQKRKALISEVVTKGLDSSVPMKDSGIDWIGEVPEHWTVKPVKFLGKLNPNKSELDQNRLESTCSFVPMSHLKTDSLQLDETKSVSEVYDGYTYFKDEDVLFAKVTPCFENRNMCIARGLHNGIGFGSSEINVFRVNDATSNRYFYYLIQEDQFMQFAKSNMTGTGGLKRVPSQIILDYKFAMPPIDEQIEIAIFIEEKCEVINSLVMETKQSIRLLKEQKESLITAAVTGQIDVREYA